jgi:acyl carrier protein|tara:strand:+ start:41 stop:268 length:228 start_codon:yes stop_codon:yes gene_type:complete
MNDLISDKIIKIISTCTKIDQNKININSCAKDFIKWDSLSHIKIMIEIEKNFKIKIKPRMMNQLISVKSILEFLS